MKTASLFFVLATFFSAVNYAAAAAHDTPPLHSEIRFSTALKANHDEAHSFWQLIDQPDFNPRRVQRCKMFRPDGSYEEVANYQWIHSAVRYQKIDEVEALIRKGADVNAVTSNGWTPLDLAIGNDAMVSMLLKHGAKTRDMLAKREPNEKRYHTIRGKIVITTLHNIPWYAKTILEGDRSAVDVMSDSLFDHLYSASITTQFADFDQKLFGTHQEVAFTALHFAALNPDPEVAKRLVEKGADKTLVEWKKFAEQSFNTLVRLTPSPEILAAHHGHYETWCALRALGVERCEQTIDLGRIAEAGNIDMARVFLNEPKLRALLSPSQTLGINFGNDVAMLHVLLALGYNIDSRRCGSATTSLAWAAQRYPDMVTVLLDAGADIYVALEEGDSECCAVKYPWIEGVAFDAALLPFYDEGSKEQQPLKVTIARLLDFDDEAMVNHFLERAQEGGLDAFADFCETQRKESFKPRKLKDAIKAAIIKWRSEKIKSARLSTL